MRQTIGAACGAVLGLVAAAFAAEGPAVRLGPESFEASQYADAVVIYVKDLDLLRARAPGLRAEVRLGGAEGARYEVDLGADWQPAAIILQKKEPGAVEAAAVTVRDGDRVLFSGTLPLGPVVTPAPALSLSAQKAAIEPGQHMGAAPEIVLPDLASLQRVALGEAERKVAVESIVSRVVCDTNFPLVSAKNNAPISRQTDDPAGRSLYVPLKSQLYDPQTGQPTKVVHYLAEAPLSADWLQGDADRTIALGAGQIKAHVTDKKTAGGAWITGDGASGLGQVTGAMTVDDRGNIYFSQVPMRVVRFNVARQEYEAPPVDVLAEFANVLPKAQDLPDAIRRKSTRTAWEGYLFIEAAGDRMFFVPSISAAYVREDNSSVVFAGVMSMPLDHWDDAAKFKSLLRYHVGSWPGQKYSLYDSWPDPSDRGRKIGGTYFVDGSLYITSYPGAHGGPWRLDVAQDGTTKDFRVVTLQDVNTAVSGHRTSRVTTNAQGRINWWDYGLATVSRANLKRIVTGKDDPAARGTLTLYYDAIAAMQAHPERYRDVLGALSGPSLSPCYMATHVPDQPGQVLGVGEYGYYLATLDLSTAEKGQVKKTYIRLDVGETPLVLPVTPGLGPYAHVWRTEGAARYLYIGGYTGLVRLKYSVDGKPLARFRMETLTGRLNENRLDKAGSGGIKWDQYLLPGLDGRIFSTGTGEAARGGTAYSGGLLSFRTDTLDSLDKLSDMSRAYSTVQLRARVVYRADGAPVQEFSLSGTGTNSGYIFKMEKDRVPQNQDPKIFLYDCPQGGRPRDLYGFSLPLLDGKGALADQSFSRNRRFLVLMLGDRLVTYDLAQGRFLDGKALAMGDGPAAVQRFCKPDHRLIWTPDDRLMLYAATPQNPQSATFYEVEVSAEGKLGLKPWITLTAKTPADLQKTFGAVIAFVQDGSGDGSYDLFLGSYWRTPDTEVRVIRDFIPPRKGA